MSTRYIDKVSRLNQITYTPNRAGIGMFGGQTFINEAGSLRALGHNEHGTVYYVNANSTGTAPGLDTNNGLSWATPFLTMSKAFSVLVSGDTILFTGKVREQLTTPVNIFDVSVIGIGNRPHHADSTPTGGQWAQATWQVPASEAVPSAPLVKVLQQGWRFENILFAGVSDNASIVLFRDAGSGDDERDASHAVIQGCRFASGLDGIHVVEVSNVLIEGNQFHDLTGFACKGVAGAGVANPLRGIFRDNITTGCANGFYVSCNQWVVAGNVFDNGGTPNTTTVLDTKGPGANGANSYVFGNVLQVATANFNTPDVVGGTGDVWTANMTPDAAGAGVSGIYEIGSPA